MKNMLDELYYSLEPLPLKYSKAVNKKLELSEKLNNLLDEEGKKMFLDYDDAGGEYLAEIGLDNFKRGYCLCFRHIFELLVNG